MRLSIAIRLGRSRKGVSRTNVAGCYFSPVTGNGTLLLDTLAAAHLGRYRDLSAFRGDERDAATRITFEVIDAFPVLGQRVKTISSAFAKSLREAGLPFESREWSLFKALTALDLKGNTSIADLMERGSL